jgi:hypothetical protein
MKQNNNDIELHNLFGNAKADIPRDLENRLNAIPNKTIIWDWAIILQTIFLTPFLIIGAIKIYPFLMDTVISLLNYSIILSWHPSIIQFNQLEFFTVTILAFTLFLYFILKDESLRREY